MKYIVITAKHHDGFGMFRSELTDWCIKSTPFQRDPLKELAAACKDAGITFCFYHSIMDWHHPDWGTAPRLERQGPRHAARHGPLHRLHERPAQGTAHAATARWASSGSTANGKPPGPTSAAWTSTITSAACSPASSSTTASARRGPGMNGMDQGQERVGDYGTPEQEIPADRLRPRAWTGNRA